MGDGALALMMKEAQEVAFLESCRVSSIRGLVVGCAIDIVEDRTREAPSRQLPEVVEIEAVFQAHVSPNESIARPSKARTDTNWSYDAVGFTDVLAPWKSLHCRNNSAPASLKAFRIISPRHRTGDCDGNFRPTKAGGLYNRRERRNRTWYGQGIGRGRRFGCHRGTKQDKGSIGFIGTAFA